mmetsp:Transcript_37197/g.119580  ORF Transcript_37197/g.119580 Transcript_37197/m.119580 type:complete len:280 (+) Transcript_37197:786-1625(+)
MDGRPRWAGWNPWRGTPRRRAGMVPEGGRRCTASSLKLQDRRESWSHAGTDPVHLTLRRVLGGGGDGPRHKLPVIDRLHGSRSRGRLLILVGFIEVGVVIVAAKDSAPPRRWRAVCRARPRRHTGRPNSWTRLPTCLRVLRMAQHDPVEDIHVLKLAKRLRIDLSQVRDERPDVLSPHKLKQLQDGRVHQIVAPNVGAQLGDERLEAPVLDDVPVVEFVFEPNAGTKESDGGKNEALVTGSGEFEHSAQHIVAQYEVLDSMCMFRHEEAEQLAHVLSRR